MDELALRTLLNNFEASRSSLHGLLHIFTWFVVVGLACDLFVIIKEFRDDWGEFSYGQIHPYENHLPRRPRISVLVFAFFGTALIVIGVAGELYVDVQAGKIETQIRGANDELLGLIIQEAGDAKTSAKNAHEELNAVKQKADVINVQLADASRQLTKLNDDLIAQGPRWKALEHGKSEFITALKPFPGQRLTVMICGRDDSERSPFEQKLMDLVRKSGWAAPEYKAWQGCPTYLTGGNEIFAVSSVNLWQHVVPYFCRGAHDIAGERGVGAAAETLCDVLNKLRISTRTFMLAPGNQKDFPMESAPVNQLPVAVWARGFFGLGTADSPAELAVEEPTKIFILVGPK